MAIHEEQPTKNCVSIARTKVSLSHSLVAQNRLSEAERIALEAYHDVRQNLGAQHPGLKEAATNLSEIYVKQEKHHDFGGRLGQPHANSSSEGR